MTQLVRYGVDGYLVDINKHTYWTSYSCLFCSMTPVAAGHSLYCSKKVCWRKQPALNGKVKRPCSWMRWGVAVDEMVLDHERLHHRARPIPALWHFEHRQPTEALVACTTTVEDFMIFVRIGEHWAADWIGWWQEFSRDWSRTSGASGMLYVIVRWEIRGDRLRQATGSGRDNVHQMF